MSQRTKIRAVDSIRKGTHTTSNTKCFGYTVEYAMGRYSEGDWVKYRSGGFYVTKKVLEVRPDGQLVTGDHDHDSDNHVIDPEYKDNLEKVRK